MGYYQCPEMMLVNDGCGKLKGMATRDLTLSGTKEGRSTGQQHKQNLGGAGEDKKSESVGEEGFECSMNFSALDPTMDDS